LFGGVELVGGDKEKERIKTKEKQELPLLVCREKVGQDLSKHMIITCIAFRLCDLICSDVMYRYLALNFFSRQRD
jgi:hypothetical protein